MHLEGCYYFFHCINNEYAVKNYKQNKIWLKMNVFEIVSYIQQLFPENKLMQVLIHLINKTFSQVYLSINMSVLHYLYLLQLCHWKI